MHNLRKLEFLSNYKIFFVNLIDRLCSFYIKKFTQNIFYSYMKVHQFYIHNDILVFIRVTTYEYHIPSTSKHDLIIGVNDTSHHIFWSKFTIPTSFGLETYFSTYIQFTLIWLNIAYIRKIMLLIVHLL